MGSSTQYLEELILKKDEEIKSLDNRCSAYLAKISLLQTRLLRTLDTLDEVQNARAEETLSSNAIIKHLKERLRRCTDIAESSEMERDDMRDAVLRLVEKVETSNDYSCWPHSQMRLSFLSDPLAHLISAEPSSIKDQDDGILSYATSIIQELRRERDAEKVSHAQTRAVAEAKILDLEAKLSRREAELESCAGHVDQDQDVTFTPKTFPKSSQDEPITSQQIISMLDVTVARNKILELEIKALSQQLDQARLKNTASTTTNFRSRALTPNRTQYPDSFQASDYFQNGQEKDTSQDQLPSRGRPSAPDNDRFVLGDLEYQIRILGRKIDAFRDERRILLKDISGTQINPNPNTHLDHLPRNGIQDRLIFLESEYDRLRQTESALRDKLDETRAQFQLREEELMNKGDTIRPDLHAATRMPTQRLPGELNGQTGNVSNLLETSDGELSMELATPLLPVSSISIPQVISSPSAHASVSQDNRRSDAPQLVDPPSPPLPPSTVPGSPLHPAQARALDQSECLRVGLVQVENELVDTQRELEPGQAALEQLEQ